MHADCQVAIRLPRSLKEDVEECAKRSGWSFAAQVRYELMERRGMLPAPYLPQRPSHEHHPTRQGKRS